MTRVLLGAVVGAHGVRGEVRIRAFTAAEESVAAYGPLTDESGARQFAIVSLRVAKPGLVVARLKGVSTRDEAERLAGTALYAPRTALPPTEEDEFYVADLIGITATTTAGRALGTVVAVHNFGAGDLLEIRAGGAGGAILVPLTLAAVPVVDPASGRVVVDETALAETVADDRPGKGASGEEGGEDTPPPIDEMRAEDA